MQNHHGFRFFEEQAFHSHVASLGEGGVDGIVAFGYFSWLWIDNTATNHSLNLLEANSF